MNDVLVRPRFLRTLGNLWSPNLLKPAGLAEPGFLTAG